MENCDIGVGIKDIEDFHEPFNTPKQASVHENEAKEKSLNDIKEGIYRKLSNL
jgi:hypothetical protein